MKTQSKAPKLIPRSKVADMLGGVCNRTIKRKEKPHGPLTPHRLSSRLTAYPEHEVMKLVFAARGETEA